MARGGLPNIVRQEQDARYAYYTLTIKNIYGALPLANKFKEYHCGRGIYETTIEYLKAFPVEYGLVDASLSADGPFGIFADPAPNETNTIIGGNDLVAVDWIAASKMGIDPMISPYMKLAVEAFGKPEIRLVGDPNPYRPWLNVPVALTLFTNKGSTRTTTSGTSCTRPPRRWTRRTSSTRTGRCTSGCSGG